MGSRSDVRTSAKVLGILFIVSTFLCVVEISSYAASARLVGLGVLYSPQSMDGYDEYMASRDPVLGWPPRSQFDGKIFDAGGARPSPAFPEDDPACLSVYGDSFTYGHGVETDEAWANQLSIRLGCRVANYGVPGFGSDQALLRFEQQEADAAPVVALFHLTENILRNVNRVRGTLYSSSEWGMKPRFIVKADGSLELIPLLDLPRDELIRALDDPQTHVPHEYFAPGGASGSQTARFPYSWAVLRALGHFHLQAEITGRPWFTEFYDPDHDSGGLEVTARVLEQFVQVAQLRGKRPLLFVMPTGLDLIHFLENGEWSYTPLLERTAELGLEVIDLGPKLIDQLDGRDPCSVFRRCSGHFNDDGNKELAEVVDRELEMRSVMSR